MDSAKPKDTMESHHDEEEKLIDMTDSQASRLDIKASTKPGTQQSEDQKQKAHIENQGLDAEVKKQADMEEKFAVELAKSRSLVLTRLP
jgi:hypothetical protein